MVDIIGGLGTTTNLAIGGILSDQLEVLGDSDWIRVNLVAGQTYRIELNGGLTNPSVLDTLLTLRDSAGAQVAVNDNAGGAANSQFSIITFTATTSGVYYLDAASGTGAPGTGSYTLAINDLSQPYSNDRIAIQLISGFNAFNNEAPRRWNVTSGGTITYNVQALSAEGQALARAAYSVWSDATGIIFSEITTAAQITHVDNQAGAFATDVFANGIIQSATVNVATAWLVTNGTGINSYSFQTYVHEIGHVLSLGHGGNYNGAATYGTDNQYLNDCWQTTIMSYFDQQQNTSINQSRAFVLTPMVADILATQMLYGAATTTRLGNTAYGFNSTAGNAIFDASVNNDIAYCIIDNGGIDTMDYSGFAQNQVINLNAESFSSIGGLTGNVTIARGTLIENAIGGTGNDTLTGNGAGNILNGGAGGDTMNGGAGDDTYVVDSTGDILSEAGGSGFDTVRTTLAGFTLAADFDALQADSAAAFFGFGNATGNIITGNNGADGLFGEGGGDFLYGGGGDDALVGGDGNDNASGGAGDDTLLMDDYTAPAASNGVDTGNGDAGNDLLWGYGGNDTLYGGADNDSLVGNDFGSAVAGFDLLFGGDGNDQFFVGLGGNAYVEGGTGNDTFFGGAINDTMRGGLGNDYLFGSTGGDFFQFLQTDFAAGNTDIVYFVDAGDRLQFSASMQTGFLFFQDLASLEYSPGLFTTGVYITAFLGGGATATITVYGTTVASLTPQVEYTL